MLFLCSPAFGQDATFDALGDLPGGEFRSHALSVSADGAVVVGYSESETGIEAFRWADGVMAGLGTLDGGDSRALDTSADGSVVVGWSSGGSVDEAFRWEGGEMIGLGSLPGGGDNSLAQAVSADGAVVVGYANSDTGDNEAFRWESGVMIGLGDFPEGPFGSWANGVSADGSVITGHGTKETLFGEYHEAFRWEDGEMAGLGFLPGGALFSNAFAISADASTIAGVADSGDGLEAFRWAGGEMESLGLLGENLNSWAYAVSADGAVVVGSSLSPTEAFIWTATEGMRDLKQVLESEYGLDLSGWTLRRAQGISDDGTVIVGEGVNPAGDNEGWRVVLYPEGFPPVVELAFALPSLEFGEVEIGAASPAQTVSLENTGDGDATGLSFHVSDDVFAIDVGPCGDVVPAGQSCEISIVFSPLEPGLVNATLEVASKEDAAAALDLTGTGIEPPKRPNDIFLDRFQTK